MSFSVGITGTRQGARPEQKDALWEVLNQTSPREVHHGDCVGIDALVNEMCETLNQRYGTRTIIHPPTRSELRAFCIPPSGAGEILPPKDYLTRNRWIVRRCEVLVGVPNTMAPRQGSGTWWTIKYAYKQGRPIAIIFPNGHVERRHP